jgi:hypothetical protein
MGNFNVEFLLSMLRSIALITIVSLFGCEDQDVGFKGTKVEKESNNGTAELGPDSDTQAVPPASISGAWLVCEWIDKSAGSGGCTVMDRDGRKLKIETMTLQFWKIQFRDGGTELKTSFVLQQPENRYHVLFQILSDQNYTNANLDIVYTQNGQFLTKNLTQVFQQGINSTLSAKGELAYTPLHDLRVPEEKISALSVADRSFYLWPNPENSAVDAGENALALAADLTGNFSAAQFLFNPDAYCGVGGVVKGEIGADWQAHLEDLSTVSFDPLQIRKEIVPGKVPIFLPAWDECVRPLRTGTQQRTAQSADGQCMFMLIQARIPAPGFTQLQPYLVILTKRFADAVGFNFSDLEDAANQYPCI